MENMYEKALRSKLRFSYRGQCTVEDLWDLKVEALDKIYAGLRAEEKELTEDTLLGASNSSEREEIVLGIAIVKHIVETKMAEKEAREAAAQRREKKQQIMSIIAKKQDEQLEGKSLDELQAMVNSL